MPRNRHVTLVAAAFGCVIPVLLLFLRSRSTLEQVSQVHITDATFVLGSPVRVTIPRRRVFEASENESSRVIPGQSLVLNQCKSNIRLALAGKSCGCIETSWSDRVFKPGEYAYLTLSSTDMHRDLLIEAAFDVAKEDKTFRLTLGQQLVFVPAIKVKPVVRIDSKFGIASENAFDLKFFTDSKTLAEIAILEFASLPRGICLSTSKRRVFLDESYVTSWVVTISSDKGVFDIEGSRVTPPSYAVISVPDGRSWSAPIVISW